MIHPSTLATPPLPTAPKDIALKDNIQVHRLSDKGESTYSTNFDSPSPNTSQLAARMKVRRTLRSLGEGGLKGFEEFRKDTSELCSEELHSMTLARLMLISRRVRFIQHGFSAAGHPKLSVPFGASV